MESKSTQNSPNLRRKALQSHVAFFDADNDGLIYPLDTYNGFRAIGFGMIISFLAMLFTHVPFSWFTFGTWIPDPLFRIRVAGIHRAVHGSDSGSYTQTGEFDERRFDYVFSLYSAPPHTHLSFKEGVRMVRGNRNVFDFFGWTAAIFEWGVTYLLLRPADGRVSKQDVHDILDGSLFPKLADKNSANKKNSAVRVKDEKKKQEPAAERHHQQQPQQQHQQHQNQQHQQHQNQQNQQPQQQQDQQTSGAAEPKTSARAEKHGAQKIGKAERRAQQESRAERYRDAAHAHKME